MAIRRNGAGVARGRNTSKSGTTPDRDTTAVREKGIPPPAY